MANIKKLKENGQDIVPITHEKAVLDSNGVTLDVKIKQINNSIPTRTSQLINDSGFTSNTVIVKDIFANNELPRVFMTSNSLGLLTTKEDAEALCECEIKINNQTIKCYATGKVQGTTSSSFPAKNFTFKFYSDKDCLIKQKIDVGWGEQYKYCFKKNWVDTTHTRNIAGARIAYDMVESRPSSEFKTNLQTAPRNGVVDGFPCKLYINGEFWGLYTWNIPKDAWMFNMNNDNPNHMVLCAETNNDGDMNVSYSTQFRKLWDGNDGAEWSIEVGTFSDSLKNSFNNAINFVMTASDEEFKTNISNYFDLYSLIDYYLFSYLTCHYDGLGKNMLMATYDGIHWGACLYDMDSIFGAVYNGSSFMLSNRPCPSGYQENNSLLWQRIESCFMDELRTRYFELRKGALSLGNIITHVEEIYDLVPDRVFADDKNKWTDLPSSTTNTITRFRNYMKDRAIYVDKCISGNTSSDMEGYKKFVFNGSENWLVLDWETYVNATNYGIYELDVTDSIDSNLDFPSDMDANPTFLCETYVPKKQRTMYDTPQEGICGTIYEGKKLIAISDIDIPSGDVQALKTYLNQNNLVVYFKII